LFDAATADPSAANARAGAKQEALMMMRWQPYTAEPQAASPDRLPVLDLYERYRDGEMFLTGAFGGVKIFIYVIKGADPDDRCWRVYLAPRLEGVDRDRARLTPKTKPDPTGWAAVRERGLGFAGTALDPLGYAADTIGVDVGDITAELLADTLQLTP
jgi:hypothetical protein